MARKCLHLHDVETIRVSPEVHGESGTWREIYIFAKNGDLFEIACFTDVNKNIKVEVMEE